MKKEEEKLDELTLILNSGDNETIIDNLLEYIHKKEAEIEEKRIIIFAGAEKVKQLEKEIILLKIEKLRAMKQYKECHLSQIPDTANIYYSMKLELEAIDEEISNLIRILENY